MPTERLKGITTPALAVDGTTMPWISAACEALAGIMPDVTRVTLDGQPHNVDAAAVAPVVAEFFAATP
jgi:hypothetical protein